VSCRRAPEKTRLLREAKFVFVDATDEQRSSTTPAFWLPLRLEDVVADGHAHPDRWTSSFV
jgi:hypothetical protein